MTALILETRDLSKQYDGYAAVSQVNLKINQGEIYGLIGPNGAGKTTLIRMLAMAEESTTGDIFISGHRIISDQPNPHIQKIIGYLPDDFPLYDDLNVEDYLSYFGRLYYLKSPELTIRIKEVLDLVSLQQKRNNLISTLSRGMKQRLSLARTVLYRPQLLLLDEPVSGLDPIARVKYRETIKQLQREGMTILISSHILSDLEDFCTSIGVMEQGHLVESSQLQELFERTSNEHHIIVDTLGVNDDLIVFLEKHPLVHSFQSSPNDTKVDLTFTGKKEDQVQLLRSLIENGFEITEFTPAQDSLEDIFINLGYQRTS